jgi:hypothetical protein
MDGTLGIPITYLDLLPTVAGATSYYQTLTNESGLCYRHLFDREVNQDTDL